MIIVKLVGGLGNQLFQYAHGKALAVEAKTDLGLDISWYKGRIDRKFMLDHFNITGKPVGLFRRLFTKSITGDFQSEKYFKGIEQTLVEEFSLKNPFSLAGDAVLHKIQSVQAVSIHLRGGDYVKGSKSSFHGTALPEYYQKSIDLIRTKVASPHFFIFTDDIAWAKNYLKFPEPFTFVSDGILEPREELMLMSQCKHNIIANSTFSWWGAWLNKNNEKIVIAPKKWFADTKADSSDIIPPSWIHL